MAEEIAESFVTLEVGRPTMMRFDKYAWQARQVLDPELGFTKTIKALVFHVIELDGLPADTIFSLVSQRARKEIESYLVGDRFRLYRFTYIKEGPGFTPPRIMSAEPI